MVKSQGLEPDLAGLSLTSSDSSLLADLGRGPLIFSQDVSAYRQLTPKYFDSNITRAGASLTSSSDSSWLAKE